ncbi:MAG: RNA 2',3'-cyclic phosphodiesterase [Bosea sp. (in: a-proteobacteria)]
MPRLFTALEVPPDVARQLALFRGGISGARWIEPADYHITLRFLGDVDRHTASAAYEDLEQTGSGPITITLDALSSFGGDKPRAIFARAQPSPALAALQGEHERLMRRLGLPSEARKFVPHVTLARMRDASPLEVAHYLASCAIVRPITFTARRFGLFSSRDSVGGGPYVLEGSYPLEQMARMSYGHGSR